MLHMERVAPPTRDINFEEPQPIPRASVMGKGNHHVHFVFGGTQIAVDHATPPTAPGAEFLAHIAVHRALQPVNQRR